MALLIIIHIVHNYVGVVYRVLKKSADCANLIRMLRFHNKKVDCAFSSQTVRLCLSLFPDGYKTWLGSKPATITGGYLAVSVMPPKKKKPPSRLDEVGRPRVLCMTSSII